jgi:hypothetical protein
MEITENRGANGLSILDQALTDPRISPRFELLSLGRMAARIRVKNSLISITELGSFPVAQQIAEVSPAASETLVRCNAREFEADCQKTPRGKPVFSNQIYGVGPWMNQGNICEESGARDLKLVEEFAGGDGRLRF